MTVYLAFNESELFTNKTFDVDHDLCGVSGVARTGFSVQSESLVSESVDISTPITTGFFHCKSRVPTKSFNSPSSGKFLRLLDATGAELCHFYFNAGGDGSVDFVSSLGTASGIKGGGTTFEIDVHFNISESTDGFFNVYIDETLVAEQAGVTSVSTSETTVAAIDFLYPGVVGSTRTEEQRWGWGQVLVSDEITFGAKVYTLTHTAGSTNTWDSGSVTDIDETNVDDTDRLSTTTNGDEFTLDTSDTLSSLSAPNSYTAVVMSIRGGYDSGSAVTKITPYVNDTTATSTTDLTDWTLTDSFDGYYRIMSNDPSDATSWTASKINDYEFGLRAKT